MDTHSPRVALLIAALVTAGCGPNFKLRSPVSFREGDLRAPQQVAVHVSPAARGHVASGWINVVPYEVDFGDSLEANAADAYGRVFSAVEVVDDFPPRGATARRFAFSVEIAESDVDPGALTFLSSSAEVALRARFAVDGVIQPDPIEARGEASVSPGMAGVAPIVNQNAYDTALQMACEYALGNALDNLTAESLRRVGRVGR